MYFVKKLNKALQFMLKRFYGLTPFIPNFFGLSGHVCNWFAGSKFFALTKFWLDHKKEFKISKGKATLKDLNVTCNVEDVLHLFNRYFVLKNKGHFSLKDDQVLVNVNGYKFLLPEFYSGVYILNEVFGEECYELFDVKNQTVIDVGAFMSDTATYFVSKGADKVVAFEANPHVYKVAKKNIQLNHLENKIFLRNQAVAKKTGKTTFNVRQDMAGNSSLHYKFEDKPIRKVQVETVTLENIVEEVGHVGLLKMDCEGAEHEILPTAYKNGTLDKIDKIIMEVHGSKQPTQPIIDILKLASFKITKQVPVNKKSFVVFAEKA